MKPQYQVLYVNFNENAIFDTLEEAKAYALAYGGKVFVVWRGKVMALEMLNDLSYVAGLNGTR